ncbi:glycoside hydrolase family 10 protein [Kinneretia aquatilis]|uniref:glycoside hydrolase family 10 protein n=1 Tax=Kinneretia aquatilis TaxID=2070761 RepID=UPI001CBFE193|nr:family 10 glycosylhydrolase [Paucibacter aquatile]WIV98301.1 family 10 glycosylhydrolase [Paucibacter aquatile]
MKRRQLLACGLSPVIGSGLGLAGCAEAPLRLPPLPGELLLEPAPELLAQAPLPLREFRAVWVATVANIDWPSRKGLSSAQQQAEAIALLDLAVQLQLNAVILQVRPSADALFDSPLEPWSEYLSGSQGQAPEPFYDPLAFWIDQAHQRGLELHAWLNPFRARQSQASSAAAAQHLSRSQPQWVRRYGDQLWIDPGEPAAADHTLAVVEDLLRRYEIDGLHLDDYFYPYPVNDTTGRELDFPDEPSWARYREAGGTLNRADWRRQNVDQLVQRLQQAVRRVRPEARFGISPFGIGKPALRPEGIAGFSQYDKLYADVERWLAEGWVDYLVPQLYWPIAQKAQAFGPLLDYWHGQNPLGRHIWPGLFSSKVTDKADSWPVDELLQQIALLRERRPGSGHAHFSMVALAQNRRGLAYALRQQAYSQPALVPATPWLAGTAAPDIPALDWRCHREVQNNGEAQLILRLQPGTRHAGSWRYWVQIRHAREGWRSRLMGSQADGSAELRLPATGVEGLVLRAVGGLGQLGPAQALRVPAD